MSKYYPTSKMNSSYLHDDKMVSWRSYLYGNSDTWKDCLYIEMDLNIEGVASKIKREFAFPIAFIVLLRNQSIKHVMYQRLDPNGVTGDHTLKYVSDWHSEVEIKWLPQA